MNKAPFSVLEWPELDSSVLLVSSCWGWYLVPSVQLLSEAVNVLGTEASPL